MAVGVTVLAIVLRVFPRPSPTSTAMPCGGVSCVALSGAELGVG